MSDPSKNGFSSNKLPPATRIGQNELILKNLFLCCDAQTIRTCRMVSRQWYYIAHIITQMRAKLVQCIVPYFVERSCCERQFPRLRLAIPIVRRLYTEFCARRLFTAESFVSPLVSLWSNSNDIPYYVFILEGVQQRMKIKSGGDRWLREALLTNLAPKIPEDCAVTGINAMYGIMGEYFDRLTTVKEPMTLSFHTNGTPGICGLVIPKLDGLNITTILPGHSPLMVPPDVKALIILSSHGDEPLDCTPSPQADYIFRFYKGQLALAGAQLDSPNTYPEYRTSNGLYHFINGTPPYDRKENFQFQSPIVIQFSGSNCKAASLYIEKKFHDTESTNYLSDRDQVMDELNHIKASLDEFRSKLTFAFDTDDKFETFGFVFFNITYYDRYKTYTDTLNIGTDLFFEVFPKTLITGVLCHSLWQHNFIPRFDDKNGSKDSKINLVSDDGIASFVLISIKKNGFA